MFERAFDEIPEHIKEQQKEFSTLFLKFAQFEQRCREFDRARGIFRAGLDILPASKSKYEIIIHELIFQLLLF